MIQTRALALLELGRVEDARLLIEQLLAGGWRDPELLELVSDAGPAATRQRILRETRR